MAVLVAMMAAIVPAAPQRPPRRLPAARPEVSPARPFPPGGHRQLPGAGEDLARHGDPGALLDGVLPGELPAILLREDRLPGPLTGLISHHRSPGCVESRGGAHRVNCSSVAAAVGLAQSHPSQ